MKEKSLKISWLLLLITACLCTLFAALYFLPVRRAQAATAGNNANDTALNAKWSVGGDGAVSASYTGTTSGDIEGRAVDGYLTYKLSENLISKDEYYISVRIGNIGDLHDYTDVGIVPWYVNNQNWVLFYIHTWGGNNANVELVSKWFVNGESNGDNWQDNSTVIYSGPRADWQNYYKNHTFNVWARIQGNQVLFGIDTVENDYVNGTNVYVPTAGRDWNSKNKYRDTFEIPGLADAVVSKWDNSYAGFDARRCSATFTDFYLENNRPAAVNQAIAYAKFDIERYVSEDNYYSEQWTAVQAAISTAKTAFEGAATIDTLNTLNAEHQGIIDKILTKDEVDVAAAKENLTWETLNCAEQIDSVSLGFDLPAIGTNGVSVSWASSNEGAIAIENGKAKVTLAFETQSVTLTATLTKGTATAVKEFAVTVAADSAELLVQGKENAKTALEAYVNNDGGFYNQTEWAEIQSVIVDAKTKIDNATNLAGINGIVENAKRAIDLITKKVNAKNDLADYAADLSAAGIPTKGEANYLPEKWAEIKSFVTLAQEQIDKATTLDEIDKIIAQAKSDIDAVENAIATEGIWTVNKNTQAYYVVANKNELAHADANSYTKNALADDLLTDGYYISATFSDVVRDGPVRIMIIPWYVNPGNYLALSISSWGGGDVELVWRYCFNGTNGDVGYKDTWAALFNATENVHNAFYAKNEFTLWARVKGDQVLFGFDTKDVTQSSNGNNYQAYSTIFASRDIGGDWHTNGENGYSRTYNINGLASQMTKNSGKNYVGFDARGVKQATVTNFYLSAKAPAAVNQAIAYEKFDIDRYVIENNYYSEQWTAVQAAISTAKKEFEGATTIADLNVLVQTHHDLIDGIFTKKEVDAAKDVKDVAAAKESLTLEIEENEAIDDWNAIKAATFTLPVTVGANGVTVSWSSNNAAIVVSNGVATVTASTDGAVSVILTATLTKNDATETKTFEVTVAQAIDEQLAAALSEAKKKANDTLDAYNNENGFYSDEEWCAIEQIVESAKNAINAAEQPSEVASALSSAEAQIAFMQEKKETKNALDEYLESYHENEYMPENWVKIEGILAQAKKAIDEAATAEEMAEIVAQTKENIEAVEKAIFTDGKWTVNKNLGTYEAVSNSTLDPNHQIVTETSYTKFELDDSFLNGDGKYEYCLSVDINVKTTGVMSVGLIAWYADPQNYLYFFVNSWNDTFIDVVIAYSINGVKKDASVRPYDGSAYGSAWQAVYFPSHTITLGARVKDDEVIFTFEDGEKLASSGIYSPDFADGLNYRTTHKLVGLSNAMQNAEKNYAGFDARKITATFSNFALGSEVSVLNQAIAYAKFDLSQIRSGYNADDYYAEQWSALTALFTEATEELSNAETQEAVEAILANCLEAVEAVKTKEQQDEVDVAAAKENLTWETLNCAEQIDSVSLGFDLPAIGTNGVSVSWASSNEGAIAIENGKAKVTLAFETQSVTLTATLTKGTATAVKEFAVTVAADSAELLVQGKENAKTALEAYVNNDGGFYNQTEWAEIQSVIVDAKTKIDNATNLAGINGIVENAKRAIDFITLKADSKNALAEYKKEDAYFEEQWKTILAIIAAAQAQIDKATTAEEIEEIVAAAQIELDAVETAIVTDGDWTVNKKEQIYTGDDTASTISDPQMQNFYLVDSEYKTGYRVSATVKTLEMNDNPGTRVGLIPWYVDSNNWISVYLSKSIWDGNAITFQIQARINGRIVFTKFDKIYDSTHELLDVAYTITVSVEDNFVAALYNGNLFMRADILGIGDACADKHVQLGFTVCNTKAMFYNLEQSEVKVEVDQGNIGNYTVTGTGEGFWSVSGINESETIIGDDSGNIGYDSWMAYYAIKQFNYSESYLVSAKMTVLKNSELVDTIRVGLIPLFVDNDNWVAVYLSKPTYAGSRITMQLQVKLGGDIVCTVSKTVFPATEELLNVARTFSVYVSGDTVLVWFEGSKTYAIGATVEGLSDLVSVSQENGIEAQSGLATFFGVTLVGVKAQFENLTVRLLAEEDLDPNLTIALTRYRLDSYKNADDYYAEEWAVIKGIIADVLNALEDEGADAEALVAEAEAKIDLVKTKAQVDDEIATALAPIVTTAKAELDAYLASMDSDVYTMENWNKMEAIVAEAKTKTESCRSEEEILAVVAQVKAALDDVTKIPVPEEPAPAEQEAPQGLSVGEIIAIVLTCVFVAAAAVGFVLTFTKFKRGKRQ